MQAVKASGSKIETALAKALFAKGFRYRKNNKTVFGKPDLTFKKYKIAIFVDSEFWHGKDWHIRINDFKSNFDFWHKKIENNIKRDKLVNQVLKREGWKVFRFWGNQIKMNLEVCVKQIEKEISKRKKTYALHKNKQKRKISSC